MIPPASPTALSTTTNPMNVTPLTQDPAASAAGGTTLQSLLDMVLDGGPMMVPIGLCSIVALAYSVERWVRLRGGKLGTARLRRDVVGAVQQGGATRALEVCAKSKSAMARVLGVGLARAGGPFLEMEKAVEDAGGREVKRLSANLKPLVVVAAIAPLLGLLGTVWGMIQAFQNIALKDGLGKPELLAAGISQALITTAAGLAIAIPTQAAYYYFKSVIERFARDTEDTYVQISNNLETA